MINAVLVLPAITFLLFTQDILQWFGYEQEVCQHAQKFFILSIPKAFLLGLFDLNRLYLGCFKNTVPAMVSQIICTLLHIVWLDLFVVHFALDIEGIALASTLTTLTMFSSVQIYARYFYAETRESYILAREEGHSIWDYGSWRDYFNLGVPGAFMYSL